MKKFFLFLNLGFFLNTQILLAEPLLEAARRVQDEQEERLRLAKMDHKLIENARLGSGLWVSVVVQEGARLDYKNSEGTTALHAAAKADHDSALSWLLRNMGYMQKKSLINSKDSYGLTPLDYALRSFSSCRVALLLKAGANPNGIESEPGNREMKGLLVQYRRKNLLKRGAFATLGAAAAVATGMLFSRHRAHSF